MDAVTVVPAPLNEPGVSYEPGSAARGRLDLALKDFASNPRVFPHMIGGEPVVGTGDRIEVVQPHQRSALLGVLRDGTQAEAAMAVAAAKGAAFAWRESTFDDRAAVFLRAAALLAGPYRETAVAATMLGQSKIPYQAEIDAACELIDFWRFNVHFARQILAEQPVSAPGAWNRGDHRPLEGFVYAVTPFNFTSIAGNLPTAPALMGNTVIWKPAPSAQLAAQVIMDLLGAAGLPSGVINLVAGHGPMISEVVLADPDLAGVHFTGSTGTFQGIWRTVGQNISGYRSYPRLVGETGGKDFVLAHPSADPLRLRRALLQGAFEYQGQKCSAASRAYLPRSIWDRMARDLADETDALTMGDVADPDTFMGALIDERAYRRVSRAIDRAITTPSVRILAGGSCDASAGWFVRPTLLTCDDPGDEVFTTEYFGPLLAVFVYEDRDYEDVCRLIDSTSPYGLTGAVFATDRAAITTATRLLRFAAGNFYINDKPTGAVVGQQPFGGGRASGTNDKAGSAANLLRWTSARSIKETLG
jgi:1-pyrroline-5-carboxylate dehydrogenase